ncbi:GNAT family N-acetyltransferase [Paenibacillus sp. GSMTC-2017]|nr:GNAT family N-acetyltransferase [Paenibacillus sp. GSMTC-2017]
MIEKVATDNRDLAKLVVELDQYLQGLYPLEAIFGVDFNDPKTKEMTFVVAYLGEVPVGCGGIRRLDTETVELKRFFVKPEIRRQGVAKKVLAYLEQQAAELGCTVMRLETGELQEESVLFYKKLGFYEIDRFGEYIDCEESYCMEKRIAE